MDNLHIKNIIMFKREKELIEALKAGWDPNYEGGWPIRLAARYGCYSLVEILISYGANPHLLSDSGASTLQLAVYSGEHWETDRWKVLLSCCDSSQLADGAAVAIIFNNRAALLRILETGRCNVHIPTTLTGKTLEQLAKGYKMMQIILEAPHPSASITVHVSDTTSRSLNNSPAERSTRPTTVFSTPNQIHHQHQMNLSPSVARFFQQTAGQSSLTSPRRTVVDSSSPTIAYLK